MANYTGNPSIFTSNCLSFLDNDQNWDLTNPFTMPLINPSFSLQNSNLDLQNLLGFSNNIEENKISQFHAKLLGNFNEATTSSAKDTNFGNESSIITNSNKRKVEDLAESSSSLYSSPPIANSLQKKNSSSKGKKSNKSMEKVEGKSKEVVHVRARRGQATDSHSIAERVRRGKINERLRCLQDIVPGCYKTMGMAVMLDEIINYVQSLQNQVEFLSMKLTAASQYYDFNAESEPLEKKQKIKACNSNEGQDVERMINKGGYDQITLDNFFQSGWPF